MTALSFDNASHPVVRAASDGEVLEVNQAAQELAEDHQLSIKQLLPPCHMQMIQQALEESGSELPTQQARQDDLSVRWSYQPHPERDEVFLYAVDVAHPQNPLTKLDLQHRYATLFRQSHDAVYIADKDGLFLDVNPAMCRMFGYEREELLGLPAHHLCHDLERHDELLEELEASGAVQDFEARLQSRQGDLLHCELTMTVQKDEEGKMLGYQGIIHNVTEERQLASFLTSTLEATADAILAVDLDGEVRYFNHKYCELWNISPEIVASSTWPELLEHARQQLTADSAQRVQHAVHQMRQDIDYESEHIAQFKSGRQIRRYVRPRRINGQIQGWVLSFTDITQFKKMEERLEYLAFHDPLTDLENRRLLEKHGQKALELARRQGHKTGLLFIDLDGFKRVNDHFGHPTGDEVLCRLAARMRDTLRDADIIARVGGDEFAVLMPQIDDIDPLQIAAQRLQDAVARPIEIQSDRHIDMVISIGIALFPDHADNFKDLLRCADQAMYLNKQETGADYSIYAPKAQPTNLEETSPEATK